MCTKSIVVINFHPFPKTSHDSRKAIMNFPQDLTGQITTCKSLTKTANYYCMYTSGLFIKLCIDHGKYNIITVTVIPIANPITYLEQILL